MKPFIQFIADNVPQSINESTKTPLVYRGVYHEEWMDNYNSSKPHKLVIKNDQYKTGLFFTDEREVAECYGNTMLECTIKLGKSFVVDAKGEYYASIKAPKAMCKDFLALSVKEVDTDLIAEYAYKNGYDSTTIKNVFEGNGASKTSNVYVVFKPEQITVNKITFKHVEDKKARHRYSSW